MSGGRKFPRRASGVPRAVAGWCRRRSARRSATGSSARAGSAHHPRERRPRPRGGHARRPHRALRRRPRARRRLTRGPERAPLKDYRLFRRKVVQAVIVQPPHATYASPDSSVRRDAWNLRVRLGALLIPTALRITRWAPASSEGEPSVATTRPRGPRSSRAPRVPRAPPTPRAAPAPRTRRRSRVGASPPPRGARTAASAEATSAGRRTGSCNAPRTSSSVPTRGVARPSTCG